MILPLDEKFIANYLTQLFKETGNTIETISQKCGIPETTIKNICKGKTENPGIITIATLVYTANGSLDIMCGKSKEEIEENVRKLMLEMYEFQLAEHRKTEETHINNIRGHYEQHREDTINNYERLLAEKDNHIKLFKRIALICFGVACIGLTILIVLLILEVTNPELGWIKF